MSNPLTLPNRLIKSACAGCKRKAATAPAKAASRAAALCPGAGIHPVLQNGEPVAVPLGLASFSSPAGAPCSSSPAGGMIPPDPSCRRPSICCLKPPAVAAGMKAWSSLSPPLEIKEIISSVFLFNLGHNRSPRQLGSDAVPAITSLCLPQQVFSSGEKAGKTT